MNRSIVAVAVVGALASAAAFVAGWDHGWDRREAKQNAADFGALVVRLDAFDTALQANRAQGDNLDEIRRLFREETRELPDALAQYVCPTDPDRLRVLRDNAVAANRALDRAAGRPPDDAAGAPDSPAGGRDKH